MNKDKWTQQLHDKLADREVAAPEGLWADIEAALPKTPAVKGKRPLLIPLRRWAIAASFAALTAGGGYLLWQANQPPTNGQELAKTDPDTPPSFPGSIENPGSPDNLEPPEDPVPSVEPAPSGVPAPSEKSLSRSEIPQIRFDDSSAESLNGSSGESLAQNVSPSEPASQSVPEDVPSGDETTRRLDNQIAMLTPKQGRKAIVSLYALNGLSDQQSANGVRMSDEMAERYDVSQYLPRRARSRDGDPIYLAGYEERQKHNQPISIGLSVGYPLSSRLSLSTGVVYTRLRSEFTSVVYDMSISRQQTLHYLGVPLNLQYHLWHSGSLNVYLSAGGAADYNIKTRMVSNGVEQQLDRDRWQFSMQGGIGIQYDVLPQLGLYAEPGVKYYFDNGSVVRNFFKDNPLNLNLQLGLRLNLSK